MRSKVYLMNIPKDLLNSMRRITLLKLNLRPKLRLLKKRKQRMQQLLRLKLRLLRKETLKRNKRRLRREKKS